MDSYIYLGRKRWLKVEPDKERSTYYESETDKDGGTYTGIVDEHHSIVISDHCPGILVASHMQDMQYRIQNRG